MITPAETGTCQLEDGEVISRAKIKVNNVKKWPYEIGEILDL